MTPFDQLTYYGKARRIRKLALNALAHYELGVKRVRFISMWTNGIYRLQTENRTPYILRICRPGWRTETDLCSEIAWLQALKRDTDIGVPEPVPASNGEYIVTIGAEGIPEPRCCVIMSWMPGIRLGLRLTEANLYQMGILFARLHKHGADFSPPSGFTRRKMDNLYARGEKEILFDDAHSGIFTLRTRDIFQQTKIRVDEAFEKLYSDQTGMRVIHNDLYHDNISIYRGRLYPFDFEDTVWGYPVQDIATAMQDLMDDVERDHFPPLQNAFRQGYESFSSWPERYAEEIDTIWAGHMLKRANDRARSKREPLREYIDTLAQTFKGFLDKGTIRKTQ